MIPELGHFAFIVALLLALALAAFSLAAARRGDAMWIALARRTATAQAVLVLVAWASLVTAFAQADFSVRNVAENANSALPLPYRIAASWGSHEGSMLLWQALQALWMLAVVHASRRWSGATAARVLFALGCVSAGFMLFVLLASNPFLRVFPIPAEGRDLNPLLQDPGMALHPPLLYMGYVGFSIAFAFAVAALLEGQPDGAWARRARPWTLAAWCFLTAGIGVGSWWAYHELGWGGWWFWDPVENAALMPWLAGTALLHALAATDRRGVFGAWTALLAIVCFVLSLLGTFLVRSGVLSSVHAFALDPQRGVFILAFLVATAGAALALLAARASRLQDAARFDVLSRESLLLANTVLLMVAAGTVMLGTLAPLAMEVAGLGRISVGAPYFDTVFVPAMAPVLFLMGAGPFLRWQRTPWAGLRARLSGSFVLAAVLGVVLPFAGAAWSPWAALGLFLAAWGVLSAAAALRGGRHGTAPGLAWYGMVLAHAGVAVLVAGVTLVRSHESELTVRVAPGDTVALAGHILTFEGVTTVSGPNYEAERARIEVARDGRWLRTLHPEKRRYPALPRAPTTEAAVASGLLGDLYVALVDADDTQAWMLRVQHKPFVTWIWSGGALMALGGLLALAGRRRARQALSLGQRRAVARVVHSRRAAQP